ncbi:MAG: GC-type dockerin domain-anchored protein, partial [Phycisphaerales bacterium]
RNEGYNGGFDTFPPFTTGRGQMHVNQYMAGIRVVGQGPTHWYSNPNGVSYTQVSQAYHPTSQTITTTRRLITGGANLFITQHDFSPKLSSTPYPAFNDGGLRQNRMLHVQRHIIRNDGAAGAPIEFFFYGDWALNGGDGFDGAYDDTAIINGQTAHAMIAFDNAGGSANSRGEYNPTTFSDYPKNVSLFLGAALKVAPSVGAGGGSFAPETWRTLGSSDNGQGWIAAPVALNPGQSVEIDVLIVGGYKDSAGFANVGDVQIRPALAWFQSNSMAALQAETDAWWTDWLDSGTTVDTPDNRYDDLFRRGLLCSALHVDGGTPFSATGGAIIAGFHNGAYPYSWPRDAVYAAVMFARTGHFAESAGAYTWMRDVAFRDNEPWGKGFWKQKYTTDGYTVWGAPQIDETAVFPWGVKWHYDATGDLGFVGSMYPAIRDAALTMSSSPSNPAELPRLNFNPSVNLMYSNNVWEDQYDFFIYSNASVHRGLEDARSLAATLGNAADAADFAARRDTIKSGLDARVDANAELTDISQLGIVYPFEVYSPVDPRSVRYIDRVNGVANDSSGNSHPLVRFDTPLNQANGWVGLIDRYWGDTYWNGGPWFLTTLWYGLYYAERADFTPGKGDIDNHKSRIDLLIPKLGPMGLGAEQIAPLSPASGPGSSLLYANQPDFTLQTAWPNAWESMSTLVDSIMAFLDYRPDAPANTMRLAPKLPSDWSTITYRNIAMGAHRVSLTLSETSNTQSALFTNNTGAPVNAAAVLKIPPGRSPCSVTLNGSPISYAFDRQTGRVNLFTRPLATGPSATTELRVQHRAGRSGDFNQSGAITIQDLFDFLAAYFAMDPATDVNESGTLSVQDLFDFMAIYFAGCA